MRIAVFGCFAIALGMPVFSPPQEAKAAQARAVLENIPVIEYEADAERSVPGWQAGTLLKAEVATDEDIGGDRGEVRDIVIGPEAQVLAVLIETGANFGIGEMTFSIPWNRIVFSSDLSKAIIDLDWAKLAPYSPYGPIDELDLAEIGQVLRFEGGELATGPGLHKVSDLLKGRSADALGPVPGTIVDLVIDPGGFVRAVVVAPPGTTVPPYDRKPFLGLFEAGG